MYEILHFSGDEVVSHESNSWTVGQRTTAPRTEAAQRKAEDSEPERPLGHNAVPGRALRCAACLDRESEDRQSTPRDIDPKEVSLPPMAFDDALTTSEDCTRLWIAAVLMDKQRGDELTRQESEILSTLGLDASWVQRMIDRAPSPGRVLRSGFI